MNRRMFLQSVAAFPIAGAVRHASTEHPQVEYASSDNEILVIRTQAGHRDTVQSVRSECPGSLVLSPTGDVLFAVNQVEEYRGLPTGSVESFAVNPMCGRLEWIGRQSLSLSSTLPRHCAVSPDGNFLVVTAYGGGTYNVLPIVNGGRIGVVRQVTKEIGRSVDAARQRSAHPHSVVFHPLGHFVFGTDLGSDRINVFRFKNGQLSRVQQCRTPPGSGPADISVDASGSIVTVHHELKRFVALYRFDPRTASLSSWFAST